MPGGGLLQYRALHIDTSLKCCYLSTKSRNTIIQRYLMYQVSIHTHFSAAHFLRNYKGKCENLHGHNWKVEVTVSSETLDDAGMAIDFTILKQKTNAIIQQLDHRHLNEISHFANLNPSSENIAAYIFNLLKEELKDTNVMLANVSVWESDTSRASYSP